MLKEQSQEIVGFSFETVIQDVRYALRQLRLNPGFTAVITLTLALSIGANSAIFSVIEGVLLKPLPYPNAEKIVRIFLTSSDYPKFPLNPFDFRDFRARNKSFESFAAFTRGDMQLSGTGEPERLSGFGITAGYFHLMGLSPEIGREFDQKNEIPGNGQQVILSDRLWRTRFEGATDIVGRKITLNMQPYTVIGVMPAGTEHPGNVYHSLPYGESVDVWWPFVFEGNPANRGSHFIEGIGRLKSGVSPEQANAEMNALMTQIGNEHGGTDWKVLVIPLHREIVGANQQMLLVLLWCRWNGVADCVRQRGQLAARASGRPAKRSLGAIGIGCATPAIDQADADREPAHLLAGRGSGCSPCSGRSKGSRLPPARGISARTRHSRQWLGIGIHVLCLHHYRHSVWIGAGSPGV